MDAQTLIDRFVAQSGGEIVANLLSKSPTFENADYLFRPDGLPPVVAELKCLTEDQASHQFKEKFEQLYEDWIKRGLVSPFWGKRTIDSANLPAECQKELFQVIGRRIKKIVNKVSRQIRETKTYFGMPEAKGLLLLVNDGNYSLESDMVLYLVGEVMNEAGSSIDTVVYFTVNMMASVPTADLNALVWIQTVHPKREGVEVQFLNWLRDGWMKFFSDFAGGPIPTFAFTDPEILSKTKFIRPPKPGTYYVNQQGSYFRCQDVVGGMVGWLAFDLPSNISHVHAVIGDDLRHIGNYQPVTDEGQIKRLAAIYNALKPRPT
jgi:hypothetical protein